MRTNFKLSVGGGVVVMINFKTGMFLATFSQGHVSRTVLQPDGRSALCQGDNSFSLLNIWLKFYDS